MIREQIKELRNYQRIFEGDRIDGNLSPIFGRAADTIEFLLERLSKNNRWVLCSERFPESDGMYLITAKVLKKMEVQYVWFQKEGKIFVCNGIAVAWQPLPEAYHE